MRQIRKWLANPHLEEIQLKLDILNEKLDLLRTENNLLDIKLNTLLSIEPNEIKPKRGRKKGS